MTAADVAQVLGLPLDLVRQRLKRLYSSGAISYSWYQDQEFYRCHFQMKQIYDVTHS
jgi:predicted ArsR family transcriptional regulator